MNKLYYFFLVFCSYIKFSCSQGLLFFTSDLFCLFSSYLHLLMRFMLSWRDLVLHACLEWALLMDPAAFMLCLSGTLLLVRWALPALSHYARPIACACAHMGVFRCRGNMCRGGLGVCALVLFGGASLPTATFLVVFVP